MIIKTSCLGCIFSNALGCELGKEVFIEQGRQYTEGFCGHLRKNAWVKNLLEVDDSFSGKKFFSYADAENRTMSILIYMENNDPKKLADTLDSINNEGGLVREIICCAKGADPELMKDFMSMQHGVKSWRFEDIKDEESFKPLRAVDLSSRLVTSSWFLPIVSGNLLHPKEIESVYEVLIDHKQNPIAFYKNPQEIGEVVTSTVAFRTMEGHVDMPWFSKVQTFNNWKDVCRKIL